MQVERAIKAPILNPVNSQTVKKEPKLFFWDWARIWDSGHRFENLVASKSTLRLLDLPKWKQGLRAPADQWLKSARDASSATPPS